MAAISSDQQHSGVCEPIVLCLAKWKKKRLMDKKYGSYFKILLQVNLEGVNSIYASAGQVLITQMLGQL